MASNAIFDNFGMSKEEYDKIKLYEPNNNWMQTIDNKKLTLRKPKAMDINPIHFGKLLWRTTRFGMHSREEYNNAQHTFLCLHLSGLVNGFPNHLRLPLLVHDLCECYSGFGDVTNPAKWLDPYVHKFLKAHEQRFKTAIANRLGFDDILIDDPLIKEIDMLALHVEKLCVMGEPPADWCQLPDLPPPLAAEIKEYRESEDFAQRAMDNDDFNQKTAQLHKWSLDYIFNAGPSFIGNLNHELALLWNETKTAEYHMSRQGV